MIIAEVKLQGAASCCSQNTITVLIQIKASSIKGVQSIRGILDEHGYNDFKMVDYFVKDIAKIIVDTPEETFII